MRSIIRACGALGVLALLWSAPAAGQETARVPRPGRREIPNLDISRNGGWRAKSRAVKAARRAALARGDLRLLNSPSMTVAVQGELNMPVVFIAYSDTTVDSLTPIIGDTGQYRALLFSPTPQPTRPYSLKTYYEQLSNGHLSIDGDVFYWVQSQRTFASVGQNCAGVFCSNINTVRANFGQFLKAALDSLNTPGHQVNWGLYDNDGPDGNPNSGDDDGVVDFVTFVHPSVGGECLVSGNTTNHIWAHRWTLSAALGFQYTTNTARTGGGTIKINDYTIQSARGGNTGCSASGIMPIGTVAHETGHTFDIPDLYATAGASEGVGEWSLMGSGNYTRAYSPAAWDAWSLVTLGWVTVDTLSTSRTVTLNPVQTSDTVLYAALAGTDEYLLLENRAFFQSDTAQMNPAYVRPKAPGLLVWHIDQSIVDGGTPGNTVNAGPIEGVHLIQADGQENLHAGTNRGDQGDSYPGSTVNHRLSYTSTPGSLRNDGTVAGFVIDSIQQASTTSPIIFRFRRSAPFRVTSNAVSFGAQVSMNGASGTTVDEIFGLGDSISLSAVDTATVNGGRSTITFTSWSDGQARLHTVVSDGTPDTLTVSYATSHRVNFLANGSGTVGTSGQATNTFVNSGTAVTLTATPTGGGLFNNWTGDTNSTNAVIVLPMGRPYAVTANFSGAVAVTYDEATDAILLITPLSSPKATYLDAVGNNNGSYDLGDYLAYLKANGVVPAPGLLRRIAGARVLTTTKEQ